MREARAEISGGIDRVPGGTAERKADHPDEEGDRQRAESAQIDHHDGAGERLDEGALKREDAEKEDKRADDLRGEICRGVADGGSGAKDRALELAGRRARPVRVVHDPDQHRADEGSGHLRAMYAGTLAQGKAPVVARAIVTAGFK